MWRFAWELEELVLRRSALYGLINSYNRSEPLKFPERIAFESCN